MVNDKGDMAMTVLVVIKRLAMSRSTYKLIGLLLVTFGVSNGSELMGWVSALVCVSTGGCGD